MAGERHPRMKGREMMELKRLLSQPLFYLFTSSFLVLFVGMGLFPLLPVYAAQMGASKTTIGVFFAAMYVSNAIGSMLPAWLAGRLTRKTLFVAGSILGIPALLLLGRATALWQVAVLTSILWLSGGLVVSLVNVFTGLYSSGRNRGKSFSLMSLPMPLGTLIGSAAVGSLVSRQGFGPMFSMLGALWVLLPLIGLFVLKDRPPASPAGGKLPATANPARFAPSFYLLLGLTIASALAVNAGRLGTSLSMQALEFSPAAIASSATVSGLVAIPLTFLIGALSDRLGRERFLAIGYLLSSAGVLLLVFATQLWQFWLAASLLLVSLSASGAMASALTSDILAPEALTRGLSWLKGMNSTASVISFAVTGIFLDNFGPQALYFVALILPVVGALVLASVGCKPRRILPLPASLRSDFFCM
jgi:DHA1 family multidrug resistance protein-like MFS transporter